MNSWLDTLPSGERQRIREKYKMSAAAYEKLREKVRGPEELAEELARNEILAQLRFGLETEPGLKDALKQQIEKDIREQGIDACVSIESLPDELKAQLEQGQFEVSVDAPEQSPQDQIVIAPEGNVSEKVALNLQLNDKYLAQFVQS